MHWDTNSAGLAKLRGKRASVQHSTPANVAPTEHTPLGQYRTVSRGKSEGGSLLGSVALEILHKKKRFKTAGARFQIVVVVVKYNLRLTNARLALGKQDPRPKAHSWTSGRLKKPESETACSRRGGEKQMPRVQKSKPDMGINACPNGQKEGKD